MQRNEGYFKKNFAKFLASYDEESFEIHKSKKSKLFEEVAGTVLEIGPGTGVNFPFLKDRDIQWVGCEPNSAMHSYLFNSAKENGIDARLIDSPAEFIGMPDNSVDYVICTEVLCSVQDVNKCLNEILRILKLSGKFLFLEHVVDRNNFWRRIVQKTVPYTPWRFYSDGCTPARDIGKAIKEIGFSEVEYTNYMRDGSGIIITINRPHISGWAKK